MTDDKRKLKPSKYNSFVTLKESGILLGYNGISTMAVEFHIDQGEIVNKVISSPNAECTKEELKVKNTLLMGGFLIPEIIDELGMLKVRNRQERFNVRSAGYTVLLTRDCNLRCPYCYQERAKGPISDEVIAALLDLAENESRGGKPISITWFGGEPLMHLDLLNDIFKKMKKIAKKNKSNFSHSFISNGYLLTPKVAKHLSKIGCKSTQITLDGPKRIHNEKRVLPGKGPTFDRIVENILGASEHMKISIRVNTDKDNVDTADELLDELEAAGVRGRADIYFARIMEVAEACVDISGVCFGVEDFSKWESRFAMKKIERGWGLPLYPLLKGAYCGADSMGGKTICPDGLIVKCWNDVSYPEEAVGHLGKPEITEAEMIRNRLKWLAWDPFEMSECMECHVFPNCMGGCPYSSMRTDNPNCGECSTLKYNLGETIALTYFHERALEEMKKRQGANGEDGCDKNCEACKG